jgi:ABC-2 type transport system ATP-binding protein
MRLRRGSRQEALDGPAADGAAAIRAEGLIKRFDEVEAVRGVSFSVPPGQTFGFLGPNGAGKSTTISMLCTLLRPSAGRASVAGFDVVERQAEVRRRIGLVFQDTTLDDYLTAEENLRFHAELYGVPRDTVSARLDRVLDLVGLGERRGSQVRTFSGGMKRRLEISRGLLHSPRVLFLDERPSGSTRRPATRSGPT